MNEIKSKILYVTTLFTLFLLIFQASISKAATVGDVVDCNDIKTCINVTKNLSWSYVDPKTGQTCKKELVVSNNPEALYQGPANRILYRDTDVCKRWRSPRFRVYWEHQRYFATDYSGNPIGDVYIGVAIFNNTGQTIKLNITKYAYIVEESTDANKSREIGCKLLYNWLNSSETEKTYATLSNGAYTYIGFRVGKPVTRFVICSGMYDFTIRDINDQLITSFGNGLTVVVYVSSVPNPSRNFLLDTQVEPKQKDKNGNEVKYGRGHFQFASRYLKWNNPQIGTQISFTSSIYDKWPVPSGINPNGSDNQTYGHEEGSTEVIDNIGAYGEDLNIDIENITSECAIVLIPGAIYPPPYYGQGVSGSHFVSAKTTNMNAVMNMNNAISTEKLGMIVKICRPGESFRITTSLPGMTCAPLYLQVISKP